MYNRALEIVWYLTMPSIIERIIEIEQMIITIRFVFFSLEIDDKQNLSSCFISGLLLPDFICKEIWCKCSNFPIIKEK